MFSFHGLAKTEMKIPQQNRREKMRKAGEKFSSRRNLLNAMRVSGPISHVLDFWMENDAGLLLLLQRIFYFFLSLTIDEKYILTVDLKSKFLKSKSREEIQSLESRLYNSF